MLIEIHGGALIRSTQCWLIDNECNASDEILVPDINFDKLLTLSMLEGRQLIF